MKPSYFAAVVFSLTTLKIIGSQFLSVSLSPSIITTKETFTVSVDSKGNKFTGYKYSFGSWEIQTTRNVIDYRYSTSGAYTLMVTAILNGSWIPWTKNVIKVFDHDTVAHSNCSINILPLMQSPVKAALAGENVTLVVNITLKDCYGVCELFFNATSNRITLTNSFISYGQIENHMVSFSSAYCSKSPVHFQITTLTKVITKVVHLTLLWKHEKCQSTAAPDATLHLSTNQTLYNSTQLSTQPIVASPTVPSPVSINGTLNVVVAVSFTLILGFYLTVIFLSYLENKKFLRSVSFPVMALQYLSLLAFVFMCKCVTCASSKGNASQLLFARPPMERENISRLPFTINKTIVYKNCICIRALSSIALLPLEGRVPLFENR